MRRDFAVSQPRFSAPAPVSAPVQQQPVIVYPRPFVPAGYLEPLTGDEPLEERRQWLTDYKIMAKTAMWSEEEMCQNIVRYVRKPISTFIRQLGKRAKSWRTLEGDISEEYMRSTESPVQKYCSLSQDKNESARHFLWRLNSAAARADIDLHSPEGLESHVNQFTRALRDQVVKQKMASVMVRSLKELDKLLALYERRTGSDRPESRSSDRSSSRDKDREYDRDRRERERSSSRPRQASTYWAYQEEHGGNDFARYASDCDEDPDEERTVRFKDDDECYDAADDEESRTFRVAGQNMAPHNRAANGRQRWSSSGQSKVSKFRQQRPPSPVQQSQQVARQPGSNPDYAPASTANGNKGPCFNCGEHDHWAAECPKRNPVCPLCTGTHPLEFCWKKWIGTESDLHARRPLYTCR